MSQQSDSVSLRDASGEASAVIVPALGGTVASLRFPSPTGARETLFQHAHYWDPATDATRGGIPLLFPLCGRLLRHGRFGEYAMADRVHRLPLHGFAMRRAWRVEDQTVSTLALSLSHFADDGFPFAVSLRTAFSLQRDLFELRCEVRNEDCSPLPFSAGWHPYFSTPDGEEGKSAMKVQLSSAAAGRYDSTYTAVAGWCCPSPDSFSAAHPLFKEMLHKARGGLAAIEWPDGFRLELETEQNGAGPIAFWQLHTERNHPFICVEPWTSPPNALNTGENLIQLAPGARWQMRLAIRSRSGP